MLKSISQLDMILCFLFYREKNYDYIILYNNIEGLCTSNQDFEELKEISNFVVGFSISMNIIFSTQSLPALRNMTHIFIHAYEEITL